MDETYDAIVIGSGIAGGWAAKELTEKGLKVLLLERGKDVKHVTDYDTATKKTWEFPHRGRITEAMKETHPVQNAITLTRNSSPTGGSMTWNAPTRKSSASIGTGDFT